VRAKIKANPRSLREEADYIPKSLDELAEFRDKAIGAGLPSSLVNGLVSWLTGKATDRPDTTSSATRAGYRKAIRDLRDAGILLGALPALGIIVMSSDCAECGHELDENDVCPHCGWSAGDLDPIAAFAAEIERAAHLAGAAA
jgi:hypothetical protein